MRKRTYMGILLAVAVVAAVCCLYFMRIDHVQLMVENGQPCISVRTAHTASTRIAQTKFMAAILCQQP